MANYLIFGGTFDPVHNGHLRMAISASLSLNADIIFVPSKSPRWKAPTADVNHRLKMLKLAMKDTASGSQISDFEINSKAEINYSIDTVKYFLKKYPNDNLFFLIGADQVNQFPKWKDAEEIAALTQVVFVSRPEYDIDESIVKTYKMRDLKFNGSGDISSSSFREMKSLDVPANVLKYIEDNRLYFIGEIAKYIPSARLDHSIQVANLAYKIAKVNKLPNPEKYYFTGILHDIGKTYSGDSKDAIEFMKEHYPEWIHLPKFSYHQFIGEYLAKEKFGITDKDMLEAIKYHCTGNKNMSDLAMVVYASDKIEPTRGFDSRFLINSCLKNYKQGFIDTLIDNKKYLLAHNKDITNELTDACFEMYIK